LKLKPINVIQVYASADASYGTYKDGKSNTGSMITIGFPNAPIYAPAILLGTYISKSHSGDRTLTIRAIVFTLDIPSNSFLFREKISRNG
jgi:hypothetical protein